jgi:uncharacterized membrane protein YeaQ/YmgE (transglycosylase-associated protein family)
MHVFFFSLVGLVAGLFARIAVPGREAAGWAIPGIVGVLGALVGGFLGLAFPLQGQEQTAGLLMSMFGAVVFLSTYQALAAFPEST